MSCFRGLGWLSSFSPKTSSPCHGNSPPSSCQPRLISETSIILVSTVSEIVVNCRNTSAHLIKHTDLQTFAHISVSYTYGYWSKLGAPIIGCFHPYRLASQSGVLPISLRSKSWRTPKLGTDSSRQKCFPDVEPLVENRLFFYLSYVMSWAVPLYPLARFECCSCLLNSWNVKCLVR